MTIQECYEALGGSFAQVEKRLPSVNLIKNFITKFLDDDSFSTLCCAVQSGNREDAFRAAHTLKGVSANLGFDRLTASSDRLTELLRPEADVIPTDAASLLEAVRQDYASTTDAIRAFLASEQQS